MSALGHAAVVSGKFPPNSRVRKRQEADATAHLCSVAFLSWASNRCGVTHQREGVFGIFTPLCTRGGQCGSKVGDDTYFSCFGYCVSLLVSSCMLRNDILQHPADVEGAYSTKLRFGSRPATKETSHSFSMCIGRLCRVTKDYPNLTSLSSRCRLFYQDMDPPNLTQAAEIYEQLGRSCMEKKLLAMNAKGYWLQAGLCLLGELRHLLASFLRDIVCIVYSVALFCAVSCFC